MKLTELIESKEYKDASRKVGEWQRRLEKADRSEIMKIRDEKSSFFFQMLKDRPELYAAFQIDDKTLSEKIYKKLTGKNIIID